MKWSQMAAATALAALPLAAAAQDTDRKDEPRTITLRGCVVDGEEKGTVALTKVTEIPNAGVSAMPPTAHGRRVVFWLDEDDDIARHANHAVEVRGELEGFEESEIELKEGRHEDGGLIAEFEGPGDDVRVAADAVPEAVGTSGRGEPEKDDVKTMLVKVDVTEVKAVDYSCREQP